MPGRLHALQKPERPRTLPILIACLGFAEVRASAAERDEMGGLTGLPLPPSVAHVLTQPSAAGSILLLVSSGSGDLSLVNQGGGESSSRTFRWPSMRFLPHAALPNCKLLISKATSLLDVCRSSWDSQHTCGVPAAAFGTTAGCAVVCVGGCIPDRARCATLDCLALALLLFRI